MSLPAIQPVKRNAALDVVRGVAVLLVLFRHMQPCPAESSAWLNGITTVLHRGGWVGVDLFFVLSGYLVSGLLFREWIKTEQVQAVRFLVRRGFKIYPGFFVLLAATLLYRTLKHYPLPTERVLGEWFFLQNYVGNLWEHTWSLAVEEHFYLLLTAGVAAMVRWKPDWMWKAWPWIFGFVALGCWLLRMMTSGVPFESLLMPTHLRIDSLLCGVLVAWGTPLPDWQPRPAILIGAAVLLLLPAFIWDMEQHPAVLVHGVIGFYLAGACLVMLAAQGMTSTAWPWRALSAMGRDSYGIYLWHIPFYVMLTRELMPSQPWLLYACTYFAGAIGAGMAATRLIELPMLRLRDRLFPATPSR